MKASMCTLLAGNYVTLFPQKDANNFRSFRYGQIRNVLHFTQVLACIKYTCLIKIFLEWYPAQGDNMKQVTAVFVPVSCSVYSTTLKMKAICSCEKSFGFDWSTQCYASEDRILHNYHFENLIPYIFAVVYSNDSA
jgi:hypothetical protein